MTSQYGVFVGTAPGAHCRTACKEKTHVSLGECLRDANIHTGAVDATVQKAWDSELEAYRDARRNGVQPASTRLRDTRRALDASDRLGAPYDAAHPFGTGV